LSIQLLLHLKCSKKRRLYWKLLEMLFCWLEIEMLSYDELVLKKLNFQKRREERICERRFWRGLRNLRKRFDLGR